jgi:uncharacterized membrane protein YphA (DoxX/SURF4 family)
MLAPVASAYSLFVRVVRWCIALVVLAYGLQKLGVLGQPQFAYDWQEVTFRRDDPHPFTMIWHFYGYSRAYGYFIAFCEIVPAVLLLVPRTATVGAAGVFMVMLNVTVMDWTFDLPRPATLLATGLLLGSTLLLWTDRRKLAPLIAK